MTETKLNAVVAELADKGWCVAPGFLEPSVVADLRNECLARNGNGLFHRAGVGRGLAEVSSKIRGDEILWIEPNDPNPAVRVYLDLTEHLRQRVNREFFLGLNDLEAHFTAYPPGAFYKKHLDRFHDDDRRALTAIVYLNENWTGTDGGALRFWTDPSGTGESLDIQPGGGTLVTFLSELYWHEVLPANRQRLALTGWYRRR